MKLKIRIAQRGIQVWIQAFGIRARIGTWVYGSPYPSKPIGKNNPGQRAVCAWIEFPWIKHKSGMYAGCNRSFGITHKDL